MSSTTGYLLGHNGKMRKSREWGNAWLSAPAIWRYSVKTYLDPKAPPGTDSYLLPSARLHYDTKVQEDHVALVRNPLWPRHLRIANLLTFDYAILKREDFLVAADALDKTYEDIKTIGITSTLNQQADWLQKHAEDLAVVGAAWQQTTVSDDLWIFYDKELDDFRSYDVNRDQNHWFVEIPD